MKAAVASLHFLAQKLNLLPSYGCLDTEARSVDI
jgi:hypothetical protein